MEPTYHNKGSCLVKDLKHEHCLDDQHLYASLTCALSNLLPEAYMFLPTALHMQSSMAVYQVTKPENIKLL